MAGSPLLSIFGVLNKLQEKVASTASSSRPFDAPKLKKLNDMVYEVHRPPPEEKAELEVVFFHGLQVRPSEDAHVTTWMTRDNSQLWLQTWLAELFPKARIFTVSYDTSAKKTHQSGRLDMYCTGENLVSSLTADDVRVGQAGCPVVLVGHCLGGLVLKELCLTAAWMLGRKSAERFGVQRVDDLYSNLRGMFFYGTPHTGSIVGDELQHYFKGALLEEIMTMKASRARRNQEFDDLKSKCGWLTSGIGELKQTFVESLRKHIHMVPEASTRPYMDNYYSAPADHYDICKPQGRNDSAFVHLKDFLKKIQDDGILQARTVADFESSDEHFIDFEGRANQVQSMLYRPDTNTIFIVGLSGIGKTSLAQQLFHNISHRFSVAHFVSLNTVDAPSKSNCRKQVLRKMQDALEGDNRGSKHNLSNMLSHLKGRRVLLVLDNVEFEDELKALHTETWLEGSASKLIITTGNARLGTPLNTFEVPYLSSTESQQLFCRYAFKAAEEPEDLRHFVSVVIKECENFPLSLKVLGGFISKEDFHDKQLWLDLLDRLQKAQEIDSHPDYKHLAKLRLCYEALPPPEQEIYLDVATFFHGFPFDMVKCIWFAGRESSHLAWKNLERRFLAKVDRFGKIWMHTLLRNLGQSVACPSKKSIEKWTRISRSSCAKELIAKHKGVVNTLGLKLEVLEKEVLTLQNTTLMNFVRLEYLILEGVRTSPLTLALPSSLVYLRWTDGFFTCCPIDFTPLEKLVALELVDCRSMKFLAPSVVKASKLIWLELGGCLSLAELPIGLPRFLEHLGLNNTSVNNLPSDLGKLRGLRHLQANQTQLTKIPQGLGRLEMLSSLTLTGTRLTTLPESVGDLKRLTFFNLSGSIVTSLPDSVGRLQELKWLNLGDTKLGSLPESIGGLRSLEDLDLHRTSVKSLPQSLGGLVHLRSLNCYSTPLETIPDSIGRLQELKALCLEDTKLCSLPESIGGLRSLETLDLHSTCVKSLPQSLGDLVHLQRLNCEETPLETLPDSIGRLQELKALHLDRTNLGSLPESIGGLRSLEVLDLYRTCVKSLPQSLGDLVHLKRLNCSWTPLETLPDSICELHHLSRLELENTQISRLPDAMGELDMLQKFVFTSRRLRGWCKTTGRLSHLVSLIVDLGQLCEIPALFLEPGEVNGRGEENALSVRDEESQMGIHSFLSQLPLLHALSTLELNGSDFPQCWLQSLFLALQRMPSLGTLSLLDFNLVEVIPCELGTLNKLNELAIRGFKTLLELPESLGELTRLERLFLVDIPKLGRFPESASALPMLSNLFISGCPNLQSVPRSFSCVSPLESESSTSQGRNCGRWDSVRDIHISIYYEVPCKGMEKLLKEAIKREGRFVLDTKVAREILTEVGLYLLGDDYGQHDGSRHCSSTSSCRCCVPIYSSSIFCNKSCDVHRCKGVSVNAGQQESDEDTEEEENEALVIKYLRALWSCLLCSGG